MQHRSKSSAMDSSTNPIYHHSQIHAKHMNNNHRNNNHTKTPTYKNMQIDTRYFNKLQSKYGKNSAELKKQKYLKTKASKLTTNNDRDNHRDKNSNLNLNVTIPFNNTNNINNDYITLSHHNISIILSNWYRTHYTRYQPLRSLRYLWKLRLNPFILSSLISYSIQS